MNRGHRLLIASCLWLAGVVACGGSGSTDSRGPEAELRRALEIPPGAERVLVVSQSSHLDLNFFETFDTYYEERVRSILESALDALDGDARYRYSVSEIGFLRRYWDENPSERERLQRHAASGALRIVGGGLSSPDTVLTVGESLLRDWALGIAWTRTHLGVTPTAAWQPDSFGHSPTLPSALEHLGFDSIAFFRVDGGQNVAVPGQTELPAPAGSTAEQLVLAETADFVWQAADGAEVLARWMPFGYGQGDDIDLAARIFFSLAPLAGIDFNQPAFLDPELTNERIAEHLEALEPFRQTPYQFLPIGIDFSWPKRALLDYLDRWNDERFPETGVWAVAATFEDYAALVGTHRDRLLRIRRDLNPYWTGFYSHKPHLKSLVRRADELLLAAEKVGTLATLAGAPYPRASLAHGWDRSAFMNHHDAITGTASEEVIRVDLEPWSEQALASGELALAEALGAFADRVDTSSLDAAETIVIFNASGYERSDVVEVEIDGPRDEGSKVRLVASDGSVLPHQRLGETRDDGVPGRQRLLLQSPGIGALGHTSVGIHFESPTTVTPGGPTVELRADGAAVEQLADADELVLANGMLRVVLRKDVGWCLTSLTGADSAELLAGPSNDLVQVEDLGGAYRLGSELGDELRPLSSSCEMQNEIEILERGAVRVVLRVTTPGATLPAERLMWLDRDSDVLVFETTTEAASDTSVVARFETVLAGDALVTSIPFGEVTRPRVAFHEPSYWPVTAWLQVVGQDGASLIAGAEGTRGWSVSPRGTVEVMIARNAFWDFLGPTGVDPHPRTTRYFLRATPPGALAHRAGIELVRPLRAGVTGQHDGAFAPSMSWISIDDELVEVAALKMAEDGSGDVVLRLVRHGRDGGEQVGTEIQIETGLGAAFEPWRANGLEDSLERLEGDGSSFHLPMLRSIETVRLVLAP